MECPLPRFLHDAVAVTSFTRELSGVQIPHRPPPFQPFLIDERECPMVRVNPLLEPGFVYFATFDFKTVKVGFATEVRKRLLQMQNASSRDIIEIDCFPGTLADERRVHFLLKKCHAKREWFWNTNLIDDLINDLSDARMLLKLEHGQDYDPTIKECLDYPNAGEEADRFFAALDRGMQILRTTSLT
jgi:T5orf172 domain